MFELIGQNLEWVFSGIGVFIVSLFFIKRKNDKNTHQGSINVSNNNYIGNNYGQRNTEIKGNPIDKENFSVLFIDDKHRDFKVVSILKKAGWTNTKSKANIKNLDDNDARNAHVIFVDVNGVAKELFQDEGLGLSLALKEKYPSKKIVIYSAQNDGDNFHAAWEKVDSRLSKNADPYQFINKVDTFFNEYNS